MRDGHPVEFDHKVNGVKPKRQMTFEELNEMLICDPEQGLLYWRPHLRRRCKLALNSYDGFGYKRGAIKGIGLRAHRVIWLLHYGEWPDGEIDHIDGNPENNRISNLRVVDRSGNMRNRAMHGRNTSGYSGICWNKKLGKWQITVCRKYGGVFANIEDAVKRRDELSEQYGFTKRLNTRRIEK